MPSATHPATPHFAAILFDLDGTLVDHESACLEGARRWARELGVSEDPDRWNAIEIAWFKAFERGEVTHRGQRIERIRDYLHSPDMPEERAMELFQVYLKHYADSWRAYPDAVDALRRALATSATVGIFTNGAQDLQKDKLVRTGLWDDRLVMFATAQLGAAKPQPASYAAVLERLALPAESVLVIGDSLRNDVLGSRAAGMHAIHLDRTGAGEVASLREIEFA